MNTAVYFSDIPVIVVHFSCASGHGVETEFAFVSVVVCTLNLSPTHVLNAYESLGKLTVSVPCAI